MSSAARRTACQSEATPTDRKTRADADDAIASPVLSSSRAANIAPLICANPKCGKLFQPKKKNSNARTCSNKCRVGLYRANAEACKDHEGDVPCLLERTGHLTFEKSGDKAEVQRATVAALKDLYRLKRVT